MMRYGVAAVAFGLYAVTSAWIIRGEGESHRKALRARVSWPKRMRPRPHGR